MIYYKSGDKLIQYNPDKIEKNSLFFWKQNKIKPRIKWLKEHINKN